MTSQTASSASYQIPSSRSRKSDNGVAIGYAKFYTRSHDAVIRVYDEVWQRDRNARARGRFQGLVKFYSHHVALSPKTKFNDSAFIEAFPGEGGGLDGIIP